MSWPKGSCKTVGSVETRLRFAGATSMAGLSGPVSRNGVGDGIPLA